MKTVDKEKLWDDYRKNPTPALREQLIIEYAQLVKLVAGRLSMYLGHNVADELRDMRIDGLSAGVSGMSESMFDYADTLDSEKIAFRYNSSLCSSFNSRNILQRYSSVTSSCIS